VIVEEARRRGADGRRPEDVRVIPGRGVECRLDGRMLRSGESGLLSGARIHEQNALVAEADRLGATAVS